MQGAMDIDYSWMRRNGEVPQFILAQQANNNEQLIARGQVRGRLETAERALRDGTAHSLGVSAQRLPKGHVPEVAVVHGPVLPQSRSSLRASR